MKTDCNLSKASYKIDPGGELTITPTISTLAACPDTSPGDDLVAWLSAAQKFLADGSNVANFIDPDSGVVGLLFERVAE